MLDSYLRALLTAATEARGVLYTATNPGQTWSEATLTEFNLRCERVRQRLHDAITAIEHRDTLPPPAWSLSPAPKKSPRKPKEPHAAS